ncbi:MAG: hypothetical protein F6J89_17075 [Symploca sp. SIO1C4]|uniref:Uncharacterized protein n=1 Tax=Symploca sp. SIO1C4 TaxID=2607765 RepID=A0A6B3NCK7_9CYAN|nr:hypothetical protein [Symploca sp. SIO1C4]
MNSFNRTLLAGVLIMNAAVVLDNTLVTAEVVPKSDAGLSREQLLEDMEPAPSVTPSVEQLQPAVTTVSMPDALVNITMINQTGTKVTYGVLGRDRQLSLEVDQSQVLNNLEAPIHISFYRPDRGPIKVITRATSVGELQVILQRGTDFNTDKSALSIQETGQVFLN